MILVKIVTDVPPHQKRLKRTTNLTYQLTHCRFKERESQALSRVHTRPGVPLRHPHLTRDPSPTSVTVRSLSDNIYWGSVTQIFNLGGTIALVRGADPHSESPLRRFLPPRWIQHNGKIFGVRYAVRLSHVLNVSTLLFQWGQL